MPSFLLFCHRFFEFRFLNTTGILEELRKKGDVTLLLPPSLAKSFRPFLPEDVKIETTDYPAHVSKFRHALINFFGDILYLTFPNTDILPNATAEYHRKYHTSRIPLFGYLAVKAGELASVNKPFLKLCRFIYQSLLPKKANQVLIQKIDPDLMIGCSFGLGLEDASFLAEAKTNNIRSVAVVQTWDRSSNKGYPTVHPDYAMVWNQIMKKECMTHMDFTEDQIIITGSPLWDRHARTLQMPYNENWRINLGIAKDHKVIFYACGDFVSHDANLEHIRVIFEAAKYQQFDQDVHVVFRLYPYYISNGTLSGRGKEKRDEIEALLKKYENVHNISILYPNYKFDGVNFMPNPEDHAYMTECLRHCDVSISMVSSQMIEATILNKPAVNLEYGRREAEKYDIMLENYRPEHLLRIYRTGAIYRVHSEKELINSINQALKNPDERIEQRKKLIEQEASVNFGKAAIYTAQKLADIANK